jgi:hypothetical protein
MKVGCRLCGDSSSALQESHVIPRFVGKYIKGTSATGFLTGMSTTGKVQRSQDLYKSKLLCRQCEERLNEHETFFANHVFHPFKRNALHSIPTDERIARFAVSVSLRVLWILLSTRGRLVNRWRGELRRLETEWRNFILETPGFVKGRNAHYVILCTMAVLRPGLRTDPNLLLGILRTSAFSLEEKSGKAFIFTNMAGVQILSMISPADLAACQGMEVYPEQTFGVHRPGIGWGGYFQTLLGLAGRLSDARNNISAQDRAMIERALRLNPKRALSSEDFKVIAWQKRLLEGQ